MSKSLYMVRWFGEAGHKVILCETPRYWCSGARFSKYVTNFYTVTDFKEDQEKYIDDMMKIIKKHNVDMYIPVCSPASEAIEAEIATKIKSIKNLNVEVLHLSSDLIYDFQDKHKFSEIIDKYGCYGPQTSLVKSEKEALELNQKL